MDNQKRFCAMCGKEWGAECEAKDHSEIKPILTLDKKIEYCQDAIKFLINCGYALRWNKHYELEHEISYDNFEKALAYFEQLKVDYQFKYHQVV